MLRDLLDGWIGLRARWRGYGLPIFASPLLPAALIAAIGGDERIVLGSALGFGASLLAARVLRRGRQGDANRASWIMAVGTGLAAHFAADLGTIFPFVMAGGALLGTRLMYTALPETAPPPPPDRRPRRRPARSRRAASGWPGSRPSAARLADPRLHGVADGDGGGAGRPDGAAGPAADGAALPDGPPGRGGAHRPAAGGRRRARRATCRPCWTN